MLSAAWLCRAFIAHYRLRHFQVVSRQQAPRSLIDSLILLLSRAVVNTLLPARRAPLVRQCPRYEAYAACARELLGRRLVFESPYSFHFPSWPSSSQHPTSACHISSMYPGTLKCYQAPRLVHFRHSSNCATGRKWFHPPAFPSPLPRLHLLLFHF